MTKYLAENEKYKVISEYESIYLHFKDKNGRTPVFIGWFYGNPDCAIISADEKYLVVGGCGILIYRLSKPFIENNPDNNASGQYFEFFNDSESPWYISGLHQEWIDESWKFFNLLEQMRIKMQFTE